jgi:hypothetical protein
MVQQLQAIASIVNLFRIGSSLPDEDTERLLESVRDLKNLSNPKSIASESKNSVFDYPFLISSNVTSLDTIAGIIKGCEGEYINMIILMAGIDPYSDSKTSISIRKKLSTYHTKSSDYNTHGGYEDVGINLLTLENSWKKANNLAYEASSGSSVPIPTHNGQTGEQHNQGNVETGENEELKTKENPDGMMHSMKTLNEKYINMFNMTMFKLKFRTDKEKSTSIEIPIGVRGIGHHLPYNELVYIMSRYITHSTQGFINRFIRWTSGEIKGLHNLLLRYDEIKSDIDYEKKVGTSNSWMKVLRSRANNHKVNILANSLHRAGKTGGKMSDILPDCTFVISMGDVDRIEETTGINLFSNVSAASKMLNESMALGLLIIDDIHSIVHVLFSSYTRYISTPIKAFAAKVKQDGDATEIMIDFMKRVA